MINLDEVKIDYYRIETACNVAPTAVRVTHIPTGIQVCYGEKKSVHYNKKITLEQLEELLKENESKTTNK